MIKKPNYVLKIYKHLILFPKYKKTGLHSYKI